MESALNRSERDEGCLMILPFPQTTPTPKKSRARKPPAKITAKARAASHPSATGALLQFPRKPRTVPTFTATVKETIPECLIAQGDKITIDPNEPCKCGDI